MSNEKLNTSTIRELWRLMGESRFRELAPLLGDGFVCEWPLTRERIRGRENYIAVNEAYPGVGSITVEELVAAGDRVVTRCHVEWDGRIDYAISFFTLIDGIVVHQVDWWPLAYDPPPRRKMWTEPMGDDEMPVLR